jgi:hypothetical protein
MSNRITPNPKSHLLKQSVIGGAGIGFPPDMAIPPGMGIVLLYVPVSTISGMSPPDIQQDLGLPWSGNDGSEVWFDELGV